MKRAAGLFCSLLLLFLAQCQGRTPNGLPSVLLKGDTVGNGGHAVVCRDENKKIVSVRLLDFYEGNVLRDTHYAMGEKDLPALDKVKLVLSRLRQLDPARAEAYQNKADEFLASAQFLPGIPEGKTLDYGYVPIPSSCSVEQLCVQRPLSNPEEKYYSISLDLWDRLDTDNRAGLILHEIVFRDALGMGHTDSIFTRRFVSELTGSGFESKSATEYEELVQILGLKKQNAGGLLWIANPIHFSAKPQTASSFDISKYLRKCGEDDKAVFSLIEGPAWASLSPGGLLTVEPSEKNLGQSVFLIASTNPKGVRAVTSLVLDVSLDDLAPGAAPSNRPYCSITALPGVVKLGETVTLNLISSGNTLQAKIDGMPVSLPLGKLVLQPTAVGNYQANGTAENASGKSSCVVSYSVREQVQARAYNITIFSAPWCKHCTAAIPAFQKDLEKTFGSDYLKLNTVLYVVTGSNPTTAPTPSIAKEHAKDLGVAFLALPDPWRWTNYAKLAGKMLLLPTFVLQNEHGDVVKVAHGSGEDLIQALIE